LILLCTSLTEVLPTIASRCCKINFAPLAALEIAKYLETSCGCNADAAQVLAIESLGSIQYAQLLASMGQADWKQHILDILKYFHQMSFEDKSTKLEALEKHIEEHGELFIEYVFEFLSKLLRDVTVVRQGWNEHVVFTHLIEDLKVLASIYVESLDFFVACIEEAIKCYKANIKLKSCLEVLLLRINHQGAMRKAIR
jgi:DNA polymerase-3 subunit delta'